MKAIPYAMFNGTTEQLRARVEAFRAARQDHAKTEGVPAPREEDFVEELARTAEEFTVLPEPVEQEPSADELKAIALEEARQQALRALDDRRLAAAAEDPAAPQEVKDYVAALAITPTDNRRA